MSLKWFGNILSYQKEYKELDKFYELFGRTDHPRLPAVVQSNKIIGAGRLNSIACYFISLAGISVIVIIQVFGYQ